MMVTFYYAVVAMAGLYMFGSTDGWRDEAISRIAFFIALLLAFPAFYIFHLIRAPAILSHEDELASTSKYTDLEQRVILLESQKARVPNPRFVKIQSSDGAKFEIQNYDVDADFCVKLNFEHSNIRALPTYPVLAQWEDMTNYVYQRIEAGTSNRIILFKSEADPISLCSRLRFFWVLGGDRHNHHSNSWVVTENFGGTIPPQGAIRLTISSIPPMEGGTRIFDIGFMADRIDLCD